MNKFGQRSLNSLKGIHPDLVKVMTESVKYSPIDFTITDGLRTTAQQQALYAKGRTTAGNKVTNADGVKNKSNHQAKYFKFSMNILDVQMIRFQIHVPRGTPMNLRSLSSPIITSSIFSQVPNLTLSGVSNVDTISPP